MRKAGPETPILTDAQIDDYHRDGFVIRRAVFTKAEIEEWRLECGRVWHDLDPDDSVSRIQKRGHKDGQAVADRLDPLLDLSPLFDKFARHDTRLGAICRQVIDSDVNIFKGKVIMKRPGTLGYGLHQDYPYWGSTGISPDHFVIIVIPLDECTVESGAIEVFPGLHGDILASPPGNPLDADESLLDLNTGVLLEMEPGDLALLHALTPHRSGTNHSSCNRTVLYFTFSHADYGNLQDRYYANRPDKDLYR